MVGQTSPKPGNLVSIRQRYNYIDASYGAGAAGVACRRVYPTRNPGFPRSQLSWGRIPSSLNPDAVMLGLRLPGRRSWGSATLMGSDEQEQTRR